MWRKWHWLPFITFTCVVQRNPPARNVDAFHSFNSSCSDRWANIFVDRKLFVSLFIRSELFWLHKRSEELAIDGKRNRSSKVVFFGLPKVTAFYTFNAVFNVKWFFILHISFSGNFSLNHFVGDSAKMVLGREKNEYRSPLMFIQQKRELVYTYTYLSNSFEFIFITWTILPHKHSICSGCPVSPF